MCSHKLLPLLTFCCLIPVALVAQPMSVIGGGQKAQDCFANAELVARNFPGIGKSLLEPCNYSLEYSDLSLQDRAATFANRGIVLAALNDFDAAMSDYDTAISMRPSAPEFYVNRGNAFFMIREYGKALEDYEESIELGIKQLHFVHYNMGMTYESLGNLGAAEREYLLALEFDSGWNLPENRLLVVRQKKAEEAAGNQQP